MSTTPDSVQPDPRDITPEGFYPKADDDVEGHVARSAAEGDEPSADSTRARADEEPGPDSWIINH